MKSFKSSSIYTIGEASFYDVPITGTFKLMAVVMDLDASLLNSFSIDLIRDGFTFRIYAPPAATYETIVWLLEGGGIVLISGDVLKFSNTADVKGRVFFSYEQSGASGPAITVTPGVSVDDAAGPHS